MSPLATVDSQRAPCSPAEVSLPAVARHIGRTGRSARTRDRDSGSGIRDSGSGTRDPGLGIRDRDPIRRFRRVRVREFAETEYQPRLKGRDNCAQAVWATSVSEETGLCEDFACFQGMTKIVSYRDLEAWQLGMLFVEDVYALTRSFPREELFGLTSQLRRAAVSIPSQIAEGHQQGTRAYRHYVVRALGSQAECETQMELARRLALAPHDQIQRVSALLSRVGQVLHGLARSLPQT